MLHAAETSYDRQIDLLAKLLFAAAIAHHGDADEARERAETALVRILQRDPDLTHFETLVEALREKIAPRQAQPLRAYCLP